MRGSRSPTSYFPFPPLLSLSPHVAGPIGGAPAPCGLVCSLTWPIKPISLSGLPGTTSGDPVSPGTLLVSKYHRPIYESLPLDHFETPRHVRDLIRKSEQTSVIKSHNS